MNVKFRRRVFIVSFIVDAELLPVGGINFHGQNKIILLVEIFSRYRNNLYEQVLNEVE